MHVEDPNDCRVDQFIIQNQFQMIGTEMEEVKKTYLLALEIKNRLISIENGLKGVQWGSDNLNLQGHPDQVFGGVTYAQHGDDLICLCLFNSIGIEKPTYLDIGAHHPCNISNTALMHARGGSGINVEANPNLFSAFKKYRPNDVNLNVGVAGKSGVMKFYMIDEESGRNTFDRKTAEAFIQENPKFSIKNILDINVVTINEIIDRYWNGNFPDFLTIDVEGLDLEILMSCDFSKSRPKIICIEISNISEYDKEILFGYMKKNNFRKVFKAHANVIFVDDRYAEYI